MDQLGQSDMRGGSGGEPFSDQIPDGARICAVLIRHGEYVDGIQLCWEMADGSVVFGPYHGGQGGTEDRFVLAPGERITAYTCSSGDLIDSLTFKTSAGNVHGPYGGGGGQSFSVDYTEFQTWWDMWDDGGTGTSTGEVAGIFGRSGDVLDALGFWITSRRLPRH